MSADVIRMIDRSAIGAGGTDDLADYLYAWSEVLRSGDFGELHSIALVVQNQSGETCTLVQSKSPMDAERTVGLLQLAMFDKMKSINP